MNKVRVVELDLTKSFEGRGVFVGGRDIETLVAPQDLLLSLYSLLSLV